MNNKFVNCVVVDPPEQGALRVWHVQNVPNTPTTYDVDCSEEAIVLIDVLIDIDLKDATVESNAFGLEEYDEELGWTEWYDDDEDDVMCILDEVYNDED